MSKCLIVYFSQSGTTARVAESVAEGLRAAGRPVDLANLKGAQPPDLDGVDLLGIGSPTYYYRPPFNVMSYVDGLPRLDGLMAFVFILHGSYRGDVGNHLRRALVAKGARDVGYFGCRGADYYLPYLNEGYLFSPDHPTAEELAQAEAFGHDVAARAAGAAAPPAAHDAPPAAIYRLERFALNAWLTRALYSRMFRVDRGTCTACGLCAKECPTQNITLDGEGRPAWGRNCLLCLSCEMHCPVDAIGSPVTLPVFRPFMVYNVRHAARDPSLAYVRVKHSRGRTKRVE